MNIMKNSSYAINAMLAFVIIAFSTLSFSSCKETTATGAGTTSGAAGDSTSTSGDGGFSGPQLPIAYIQVDSVLVNYNFAKDVNERLTKKAEDLRTQLNQKTKKLEKDMEEFQRKAQNNAFISDERAQQEYNRLQKQDQELQQTAERLRNEFGMEQMKVNMEIADSIRIVVKAYNEVGKYQMVFNMRELDNIILANPKYDITQGVLTLLNSRYKPGEKK